MTFDKIHSARLTKLADHLEAGKLGQGVFDFAFFHQENPCGSAGCAIGELPHLWPAEWEYKADANCYSFNNSVRCEVVRKGRNSGTQDVVTAWFGLKGPEYRHIFIPHYQDTLEYGGDHLDATATSCQVAGNIREFLKIKGQEL